MGPEQALAQLTDLVDEYGNNTDNEALATLRAELDGLRADAERGREIAAAFLPVMEAARPLVLNLERLRDAAKGASHEP